VLSLTSVEKIEKYMSRLKSQKLVMSLIIIGSILIMGGLLYVIVNEPPPLYREGPFAYGLNRQTIVEMFIVALAYAMGFAGLYLVYNIKRYYYDTRFLTINLLSGSLLLLLSMLLLQSIYAIKAGY